MVLVCKNISSFIHHVCSCSLNSLNYFKGNLAFSILILKAHIKQTHTILEDQVM